MMPNGNRSPNVSPPPFMFLLSRFSFSHNTMKPWHTNPNPCQHSTPMHLHPPVTHTYVTSIEHMCLYNTPGSTALLAGARDRGGGTQLPLTPYTCCPNIKGCIYKVPYSVFMFPYQSTQSKERNWKHQNQKSDEHVNNLLTVCNR